MGIRHFKRGRSTFNCVVCDRRTRDTIDSSTDLCGQCYDLSGMENALFDGCFDESGGTKERDRLLKELVKLGRNEASIKGHFPELFAKE